MSARAVIDARGLEEKSIWRVEQLREKVNGGQVVREVDVGKCRGEEAGSNEKR